MLPSGRRDDDHGRDSRDDPSNCPSGPDQESAGHVLNAIDLPLPERSDYPKTLVIR